MKKEYICRYCWQALEDEELEYSHRDDTGEAMCDKCYQNHYQLICPVCKEFFDKAQKVEDYYFAITREAINEYGVEYENETMRPGIYKALEWPMFHGDCVTGFNGFFNGTIKLLKEIDLSDEAYCEEICYDCVIKVRQESKKCQL